MKTFASLQLLQLWEELKQYKRVIPNYTQNDLSN